MKNNYKILLCFFLLIFGKSICYGKKFVVTNIEYLITDKSATDSLTRVNDHNDKVCALIKLPFPKVDESVISGDQIIKKEFHGNEWYIYMPEETYKFFIKYPGYEDLEVDLSKKFKKGVVSGKTYRVTIPYGDDVVAKEYPNPKGQPINIGTSSTVSNSNSYTSYSSVSPLKRESLITNNSFYLQVGYNIIGLSGLNIGVGGYISNFNIEANYLIGFSKSEDIYWNNTSGENMPILATYSSMGFNLKVGYGIKLSDRFRLTPRLGMQYTVLQEKSANKVANNANALGIPIGIKLDFAVAKHFGLSLEPSYLINVSKSEGYETLSDISNKIKGYADSFGLNIGLYCNF